MASRKKPSPPPPDATLRPQTGFADTVSATAERISVANPSAAAFYVFVLDQNSGNQESWVCNGTSANFDLLFGQVCYPEPARSLPRSMFIAVSSSPIAAAIGPCTNADAVPEGGIVYGLRHA